MTVYKLIPVCITATIIVFTITKCEESQDKLIVDMVSKGTNPVEAACAIKPLSIRPELCSLYKINKLSKGE